MDCPKEEEALQSTYLLYAEFANRLSSLAGWLEEEQQKSKGRLFLHIPLPDTGEETC